MEGPSADMNDTTRSFTVNSNLDLSSIEEDEMENDSDSLHRFQDSDDEDDEDVIMADEIDMRMQLQLPLSRSPKALPEDLTEEARRDSESWDTVEHERHEGTTDSNGATGDQTVVPRISLPGSPTSKALHLGSETADQAANAVGQKRPQAPAAERTVPGPRKIRVLITDSAYSTYRAVLYYVSQPF
jgi:hypothetical protein